MLDSAALAEAIASGKVAGAGLDVFDPEPLPADSPLLSCDTVVATPHIAGSTEEAQEIVGVRIAEQLAEYLKNGIAINAVNMPALSPEQYRAVGPYVLLAERLGNFAAHIATGNPKSVRLVYQGRIAGFNTQLLRNAGLAGVLNRSLSQRANLVNAMQLASQRGLTVAEQHEQRIGPMDAIRLELETDSGAMVVEGAVVLDKPRLLMVDGIYCEVMLGGNLVYLKNVDVPGVIGHVGGVLGRNNINIANFSLGRQDKPLTPGQPLEALAVVETDTLVPESVLAQLKENPAVKFARSVALSS
jgi:D-3-phosphoglycerate dehydrogenase